MVVRGIYLEKFEPIVQPLEFLETFPKKKFYQVEMVYILPLFSVDLCDADHLNANVTTTESSEVEIDDIYLDDDEIAQYRVIPRDDFNITYMAKPRARQYLTIRNQIFSIPTQFDDPRTNVAIEKLNLNEIFQFENTEMWVKATSNTATLTAARLEFFGYRLIVTPVNSLPNGVRATRIPTEGYPGSPR